MLTIILGHTSEPNTLLCLQQGATLLRPRIPTIRNLHRTTPSFPAPNTRRTTSYAMSDIANMV